MHRLSPEERERVRDFVRHVVEWSGRGWDELAYISGVPFTTVQGWRYGRATPEAPWLLAFLKAAGVLDENYRITAAPPAADQQVREELGAALREAEAPVRSATGQRARGGREKT
jgi:hypothetical protein